MSVLLIALAGWVLVSGAAGVIWRFRERKAPPTPAVLTRIPSQILLLVLAGLSQLGMAIVAALTPATPVATWLGIGAAAVSAILTGGTVATIILGLAKAATPKAATGQNGVIIRRDMLRGGTWIGVLERIGILASLLTWVEGVVLILAIKGLARYPELKAGATSGTAERFIIGTFISFGWAASCAGIGWLIIN